jgi:hypothetical protein
MTIDEPYEISETDERQCAHLREQWREWGVLYARDDASHAPKLHQIPRMRQCLSLLPSTYTQA